MRLLNDRFPVGANKDSICSDIKNNFSEPPYSISVADDKGAHRLHFRISCDCEKRRHIYNILINYDNNTKRVTNLIYYSINSDNQ